MRLQAICDTILSESSSPQQLRDALDKFAQLCSGIGGVVPDPCFDAWAEDSMLDSGVAISPQAAAHCVRDYRRSVMYIRAVNAAIHAAKDRFPGEPVKILYAGCGPYATLLLPLLGTFEPGELDLCLLDLHQRSLDSVRRLVTYFGFGTQRITTVQADACHYQHAEPVHLIIAEIMQKSLEQEPQFEITANLAPQLCDCGIFIPEKIEVQLCLADVDSEMELFKRRQEIDSQALVNAGRRYPLATLMRLVPGRAATQRREAVLNQGTSKLELPPVTAQIPPLDNADGFEAVMFTRIQVYAEYRLRDYEAEITLPARCAELSPLSSGACFEIGYQLGSYPRFNIAPVTAQSGPRSR
jgi:hypothetical protein